MRADDSVGGWVGAGDSVNAWVGADDSVDAWVGADDSVNVWVGADDSVDVCVGADDSVGACVGADDSVDAWVVVDVCCTGQYKYQSTTSTIGTCNPGSVGLPRGLHVPVEPVDQPCGTGGLTRELPA